MMRIIGFRAANTASTQLRVVNWMEGLRRRGHDVETHGSPFGQHGALTGDEADVREWVRDFDSWVNGADVVIYGMSADAREIAMLQAGRAVHHYRLVVDTDDLFTEVPTYNQASMAYNNATGITRVAEAQFRDADAVTVSTPFLRDKMRKLALNPHVHYAPNCVDPSLYESLRFREKEARHRDDLRIFWSGGGGHWDDLLLVKDALLRIADENPRVKLVFGNFIPAWAAHLPCSRVFFIPMQPFAAYWQVLAWICADVGVAPLVLSDFNRSKSHVKYLDYAITRVPGVYSDICAYDSVEDGVAGLKAQTSEEWYTQITRLLNDAELRRGIVKSAYRDVTARWAVDAHIDKYEQMLIDVTKRPIKVIDLHVAKPLAEGVPVEVRPWQPSSSESAPAGKPSAPLAATSSAK